jgi:hypothetical protein
LKKEADNSQLGDSFERVKSTETYRLGVGYKTVKDSHVVPFIELMMKICSDEKLDIDDLEAKIDILRTLKTKRYDLKCEDDGTITCTASVNEVDLVNELESISILLSK